MKTWALHLQIYVSRVCVFIGFYYGEMKITAVIDALLARAPLVVLVVAVHTGNMTVLIY